MHFLCVIAHREPEAGQGSSFVFIQCTPLIKLAKTLVTNEVSFFIDIDTSPLSSILVVAVPMIKQQLSF
jgi:hypothetical protein